MKCLDELNEKQYEAVTTSAQYARVVAGAGSGKTKVLTYRMAFLIKEGCNLNARDSFGNTPLMIAVAEERMDMITFLMHQPDIQIDVQNYYGETLASIAKLNNNIDIINYIKTWSPITDIEGQPIPEFVETTAGNGKLII